MLYCAICQDRVRLSDQRHFGPDDGYVKCPRCQKVIFVFDDEGDIRRNFEPIIEGDTVEAVVHSFAKMGPYRLARIPAEKEIAWSLYVSRQGAVFAYKSTRKRWIALEPGTYFTDGSRPLVSLARNSSWPGSSHGKFKVYQLLVWAGWVPRGRRGTAVLEHLDDDVANNDVKNLAP